MSKMITKTRDIEPQSILKTTLRKISYNPADFRSPELTRWNSQIEQRQNKLLKTICERITLEERQNIKKLASQQTKQQYSKLKSRLRKNAQKQVVASIIDGKKDKRANDLSIIMKVKTELIDLGQKYNNRINMKMRLFNEASTIDDQKTKYAKWYNTVNNSPTNSPIYKKINYLIQKVTQKDRNSPTAMQPLRSRVNQQIVTQKGSNQYKKIKRFLKNPANSRISISKN